MYRASIKLDFGERAQDYFAVMDKKIKFKRSNAKLIRKGGTISIDLEADDAIALISTINSFIKQIRVIGDIEKLTEK